MRTILFLSLMIVSAWAGCGDSASDDNKDDDSEEDAGNTGGDDTSNNGDGKLPDLDDGDVSDCDKGDPCCINSDEYDFVRCSSIPDAGAEADAGDAAAN